MPNESKETNPDKVDYVKLVTILEGISPDEIRASAEKPGQPDFKKCCGYSIYEPAVDKIAGIIADAYGSGQDEKEIRNAVQDACGIVGHRLYLPGTGVFNSENEERLTATLLYIYEKIAAELAKRLQQKPEVVEAMSVRNKVADTTQK
jgi:hypothetical protein